MTLLLTGASGFIGQALLRNLSNSNFDIIALYRTKKNYEKRKINSSNITYLNLDLTNKNDFKKINRKVNIVIHLAAQVFKPAKKNLFGDFLNSNVLGTYNLLEFCKDKDVKKIIYMSSKYVYGEPELEKVDETYPSQPCGTFFYYGLSKLICEYLCRRYSHDFGIKSLIFRLSPIFGEEQGDQHLIPRLIKKIKNNQKIILYGTGSNIMEYLYVNDCVGIIMKSLDTHHDGIYNIGPGKALTLKEIVDKILKVYSNNQPTIVYYEPKQNHSEKGFILNVKKAEKELEFKTIYTFEDGLNKFKQGS